MKNKTQKMVGIGIVMLFAFITIFHPVAADTTPQYGRIDGTTSYVQGWGIYPIAFVQVSTGSLYDYSNIFGEFAIDDVPLGIYPVIASKWGFISVMFLVELTESSPFVHIDFILTETEGDGGGSDGASYVVKSVRNINNIDVTCYQVHLQPKL